MNLQFLPGTTELLYARLQGSSLLYHPVPPQTIPLPLLSSLSNSYIPCPQKLQTRAAGGFGILTLVYLLVVVPAERLATWEANLVRRAKPINVARRELYILTTKFFF